MHNAPDTDDDDVHRDCRDGLADGLIMPDMPWQSAPVPCRSTQQDGHRRGTRRDTRVWYCSRWV